MRIPWSVESLDNPILVFRGDIYDRGDSVSVGRLDIFINGKGRDISTELTTLQYKQFEQEFSDLYAQAKADGEFAPPGQSEFRKEEAG